MGWIPCGVDCSVYRGGKFIIGCRMPWIVNSEGKFNKMCTVQWGAYSE